MLLLHGVGLRAESWAKQLLAFDGHVQLIALDLPGHGESARLAPRTPRLEDYRDALVRFIEEVIGQPVILAGHSLGGLLALELACARSDLTLGLAALNTVFQRSPGWVMPKRDRRYSERAKERYARWRHRVRADPALVWRYAGGGGAGRG